MTRIANVSRKTSETDIEINIDFQLRPDGSRSMNIPVRYIMTLFLGILPN